MASLRGIARRLGFRVRELEENERGAILIEAAIILPILGATVISLVDVGLYILAHQKSQRAATTVGDLIARMENASVEEVQNLIDAAEHVMRPFDLAANGGVVVTSVTKPEGQAPRVDWQVAEVGGSGMTSQVGTAGGPATLANGLTLVDGENIIVAEVEYDYDFLFAEFLDPGGNIYHDAFFRPRGDALSELN